MFNITLHSDKMKYYRIFFYENPYFQAINGDFADIVSGQ